MTSNLHEVKMSEWQIKTVNMFFRAVQLTVDPSTMECIWKRMRVLEDMENNPEAFKPIKQDGEILRLKKEREEIKRQELFEHNEKYGIRQRKKRI